MQMLRLFAQPPTNASATKFKVRTLAICDYLVVVSETANPSAQTLGDGLISVARADYIRTPLPRLPKAVAILSAPGQPSSIRYWISIRISSD